MKVAVIGAGIGGLAIAIRMAVRGYQVEVFEKNSYPGGKLAELRVNGFRFDTGPSLFTLPELIEELFTLCDEDIQPLLPYKRLDINCKYFYPDGTVFNFYHDKDLLKQEVENKFPKDKKALFKRLSSSKEVYELSAPVFLFSSFQKLSNFNTPPYKKIARQLYKLDFFRTMHWANYRSFKNEKLVQVFDRYATYNGSDPYRTPATLNMIAHLENNIGAFFPLKGMHSIPENLYQLAIKKGVQFHFNERIEEIRVEDKTIKGIKTNKVNKSFDMVISDIDVKQISRNLINKYPLRRRLERMESSSSAIIFYWGMNRTFPNLEIHNILFSDNYKKEFKNLFKNKKTEEDPTVYIFISSKLVTGDAPLDQENWFVMVNAPSGKQIDWKSFIQETRENIIRKINKTFDITIEKHIISEEIASPFTIEEKTGSIGGALYGASSNSILSAFLRHPNYISDISGLYFVGGSVHPGGGIPLCLASASIVEKEIISKYESVQA